MIHLKLTIMALLWAGGFIAGKVVMQFAGPFTVAFIRFFIAAAVLAIFVPRNAYKQVIHPRVLAQAALTAFVGVLCYNYVFFSGVKLVEAGRGSVIMGMVPVAVTLIGWMMRLERVTIVKWVGVTLSLVGAWVVVTEGDVTGMAMSSVGLGEGYLLAGVACAAFFSLCSKRLLKDLSPIAALVLTAGLGTVLLVVPMALELLRMPPVDWTDNRFILSVLYLALGPNVVAVLFYYEGIHLLGPSRASQYMNLMPVFGVVLSCVILGEAVSVSLAAGGVMVLAGLMVNNVSLDWFGWLGVFLKFKEPSVDPVT